MRATRSIWCSTLLLVAGLFLSGALRAAERPFDAAEFEAAQRAGKPVLVSVHADWCPVCRVQEEVLGGLLGRKEFAGFAVFIVDYDLQKAVLKRFGVRSQSTLIVFKGTKEVARSIAQTNKDAIAADLAKAL
ncbi:MAG: thioredoxin [Betaproteobacteria bacterium]|nr:MAG: thioredoxin [Betaproteobacteria bacterium]